jgi:hypothetical protein
MNQAIGAMTSWGKSYACQHYAEQNMDAFEGVVLVDYKDEYKGLVETFDVKRLTVPAGAETITAETWRQKLADDSQVQLARAGATTEQFREAMATVIRALSEADGTWFVVLDEAHKLAPQREKCPDPFVTLATTWHGDGMGVVWVSQRLTELEETILAECQASLLGGFRSVNDLSKIEAVEYPPEVHLATTGTVDRPLPEELLVDGEPRRLRRWEDDDGHTTGSEWVYSDTGDLRRIDSRDWTLESTHYGSDRKRIRQPFEES